jgi:hypothetical protein
VLGSFVIAQLIHSATIMLQCLSEFRLVSVRRRSCSKTKGAFRRQLNFSAYGRDAVKIMLVGILDLRLDDVTDAQPPGVAQMHLAVDFRSIGFGAAGCAVALRVDGVDQDVDGLADLASELFSTDSC